MIFLTVGSQLPFDRLTEAVDAWTACHPGVEVFGQVGLTDRPPSHFTSVATMSPTEYMRRFAEADLIVAHAGMGTIINALELRKPMLMLPRLARFKESRNDNQVGTARHFSSYQSFQVIDSESLLSSTVDHMLAHLDEYGKASDTFGVTSALIAAIREFVNS